MFKKIIIILITSFFIFSCGEDEKITTEEPNKKVVGLRFYPGEDFSINIPAAWNIITDNDKVLEKPSHGEVELAITSADTKNGFANNLIILSQILEEETNSRDYSIINNIGAEKDYLNYYKKNGLEFNFIDGEKSMIYNFEAKYSEETPMLQFLQTAHMCDKKAFLITIALPLDIEDIKKYEEMISSFKCKK